MLQGVKSPAQEQKNAIKTSRDKKTCSQTSKKIKIQSCFPFAIAKRITTFSTLLSCNKKTPKHGQHILSAKFSDASCAFKLIINY